MNIGIYFTKSVFDSLLIFMRSKTHCSIDAAIDQLEHLFDLNQLNTQYHFESLVACFADILGEFDVNYHTEQICRRICVALQFYLKDEQNLMYVKEMLGASLSKFA